MAYIKLGDKSSSCPCQPLLLFALRMSLHMRPASSTEAQDCGEKNSTLRISWFG